MALASVVVAGLQDDQIVVVDDVPTLGREHESHSRNDASNSIVCPRSCHHTSSKTMMCGDMNRFQADVDRMK